MPSIDSKTKNLVKALESRTKPAIKLSVKALLYSTLFFKLISRYFVKGCCTKAENSSINIVTPIVCFINIPSMCSININQRKILFNVFYVFVIKHIQDRGKIEQTVSLLYLKLRLRN